MSFDIRNHLAALTSDGGSESVTEQSFQCPVCGANNFKVNMANGKYSTFSCDCAKTKAGKRKIRDTVAPLTWQKATRPENRQEFIYNRLVNGTVEHLVQVVRTDNSIGKRQFRQEHWNGQDWIPGLPNDIKTSLHLYCIYHPVNENAKGKQPILIVEGEGKADLLIRLGIPATCSIGGAGKWKQYGYPNYLEDLKGYEVILCPDRDEPGLKHCQEVAADLQANGILIAGWLYAIPSSPLWNRLPKNRGADVADWVADLQKEGLNDELIKQRVLESIESERETKSSRPKTLADFLEDAAAISASDRSKEQASILIKEAYPVLQVDELDRLKDELKAVAGITKQALNLAIKADQQRRADEAQDARQRALERLGECYIPIRQNSTGGAELPEQGVTVEAIAEHYKDLLAWDNIRQQFYRYESSYPGVWSALAPELTQKLIIDVLNANGAKGNYTRGYLFGVIELAKSHLAGDFLQGDKGCHLLPFRNGVLDVQSGDLKPHSPDHRIRWSLPYDYDSSATCEPIQQWLLEANNGYDDRVQLCRAWVKAVLLGRFDLQHFLNLTGPGGTGKGTFFRLVQAVVGLQNTVVSSLEAIEGNRFETAALYGKRLLVIPEASRFTTEPNVLKSITGSDPIRLELKGVQQSEPFVFQGLVMVSGNSPLKTGDHSSGIERRKIVLLFTNTVAAKDRQVMLDFDQDKQPFGALAPYLPGFVNWVMSMPSEQMEYYIKQWREAVPSLAASKAEDLIETNPLAAWVDECLVVCSAARTYIGSAQAQASTHLYPNYMEFCDRQGTKIPISLTSFSRMLLDFLNNQLNIAVTKDRDRSGAYIIGIDIRRSDDQSPRLITNVMECDGSVMGCVTGQTPGSVECDGYAGFSKMTHTQEKNIVRECVQTSLSPTMSNSSDIRSGENPSHPSHPSPTGVLPIAQPVTQPVTTSHPNGIKLFQYYEYVGRSQPWLSGRVKPTLLLDGGMVKVKDTDGKYFDVNVEELKPWELAHDDASRAIA